MYDVNYQDETFKKTLHTSLTSLLVDGIHAFQYGHHLKEKVAYLRSYYTTFKTAQKENNHVLTKFVDRIFIEFVGK